MKKKIVSILVCLLCGLSMSARPLFGDARLFVNDWRFKLQDDAVIKLDANH